MRKQAQSFQDRVSLAANAMMHTRMQEQNQKIDRKQFEVLICMCTLDFRDIQI